MRACVHIFVTKSASTTLAKLKGGKRLDVTDVTRISDYVVVTRDSERERERERERVMPGERNRDALSE